MSHSGNSSGSGQRFDEFRYFNYELDPLFSRHEAELFQSFLIKHGRMPDADDDDWDDEDY